MHFFQALVLQAEPFCKSRVKLSNYFVKIEKESLKNIRVKCSDSIDNMLTGL